MNPYEQRRRRVLDQLQFGEMVVLYSGESVASSMDEGFEFDGWYDELGDRLCKDLVWNDTCGAGRTIVAWFRSK